MAHSKWERAVPYRMPDGADAALSRTGKTIARLPVTALLAIGLALVALVAGLDALTGGEASFSVFYLIPIAFATWSVGGRAGLVFALLSAAAWGYLDIAFGRPYSSAVAPHWNMMVRLGFFVVVIWLIVRLRYANKRVAALARTDALTGVPNARAFEERAGVLIADVARTKEPFTLVYLDLDRFKQVNDEFGHSEGDRLLRVVAHAIDGRVRATDMFARIGGDEFVVLMPHTDAAQAEMAVSGMESAVAQGIDPRWGVGMTIGVVTFYEPPEDADAMVHAADTLMYEGKNQGRGVALFSSWPEPVDQSAVQSSQ